MTVEGAVAREDDYYQVNEGAEAELEGVRIKKAVAILLIPGNLEL